MNGADTAWIIVAQALVLFMTLPRLALFHGGLVRGKNVLSVFMHCYAIARLSGLAIVGVFATVMNVLLIFICKAVTALRVDEDSETTGLDLAVHGERAYEFNS